MDEAWRDEARKRLPDLSEEVDGPGYAGYSDIIGRPKYFYELCQSLAMAIWSLYDRAGIIGDRVIHLEPDREKVAAIYDYACWCMAGPDLRGELLFAFWKSIGPHINPAIQRDLPAFLTKFQLMDLEREGIFPPKRGADEQRDVRRRGKRRN